MPSSWTLALGLAAGVDARELETSADTREQAPMSESVASTAALRGMVATFPRSRAAIQDRRVFAERGPLR
jgi:hypothetical protein